MPRAPLGAFYLDALRPITVPTRPLVINRVPENDERSVPVDAPVRLTVIDPGAAGLAATTQVHVTVAGVTVLAYDQAAPVPFHADYVAGSTASFHASPGSLVNDELDLVLRRATPWPSTGAVTVRVVATTADPPPTPVFDGEYTFVVIDATPPQLLSARTFGLRALEVRFTEPVWYGTGALGDATRVRVLRGGAQFLPGAPAGGVVACAADAFEVDDVGLFLGVVRANDVFNDGWCLITGRPDPQHLQVDRAFNVDESLSNEALLVVSPYRLVPTADPTRLTPAFTPVITGVEVLVAEGVVAPAEGVAETFELALEQDLTPGREYALEVAVGAVRDYVLNPVAGASATFTAETLAAPPRRRFTVYDRVPAKAVREDATGDLRRFLNVIDETALLLLADTDRFGHLWDIDRAPASALDVFLAHMGSPFAFTQLMPTYEKRRLLAVIVDIYKRKGLQRGMADALTYLFGVPVTVVPYNPPAGTWTLGVSRLDVDTYLGMDRVFLRYAFEVRVPRVLTSREYSVLLEVVHFMRPAHTHFVRLVGGFGMPGQQLRENVTLVTDTSSGSPTPFIAGSFTLRPSDYDLSGTTRQVRFKALGFVTALGLHGTVQLYNQTDGVAAATLTFTDTSPAALVSSALALPSTEKLYEVRVALTDGADPAHLVVCRYAGLQIDNVFV